MLIKSTTIQSEVDPNLELILTRDTETLEWPRGTGDVLVEWKRRDGSTGPLLMFDPDATDETQFEYADCLAAAIWGKDRKGRANATNSMVHDVWDLLKQIAGA